jgi:23S rRNA G2069 N7-methylase RlmK/C1962 C5-methylase RlmI
VQEEMSNRIINITVGVSNVFKLLESIYLVETTTNIKVLLNQAERVTIKFEELVKSRKEDIFNTVINKANETYQQDYSRELTEFQYKLLQEMEIQEFQTLVFERYKDLILKTIEKRFKRRKSPAAIEKIHQELNHYETKVYKLTMNLDLGYLNSFKAIYHQKFTEKVL